ncbi:MAG TPA: hypothetical protein VNH11_27520 [Pirellulales bacterium]|nr:hypothetical protein [Pirellulales bacterium]
MVAIFGRNPEETKNANGDRSSTLPPARPRLSPGKTVEESKTTKSARAASPGIAPHDATFLQDGKSAQRVPAPHNAPTAKAAQAVPAPKSAGAADPPAPGKSASAPTPESELERLTRLEKKLAVYYHTAWLKAAEALSEIHRDRLYRHVAQSFSQYLADRWTDMKERHALKLITGWGVMKNVRKVSDSLSLNAALQLSRLPQDEQAVCLQKAMAAAGPRGPSGPEVAKAVAEQRPPRKTKAKARKQLKKIIKLKSGTIRLKRGAADLKSLIAELQALMDEAAAQLAAQTARDAA